MPLKNHYPTPSSVQYYMSDALIDDIYRIDFKRAINRQPVYGYDSRRFDFVVDGKELITGNIIINFRYPGYLRNIIMDQRIRENENAKLLSRKLGQDNEDKFTYIDAENMMRNIDSVSTVEDKAKIISNLLIGQKDGANLQLANSSTIIRQLKENYHRRFNTLSNSEYNAGSPQSVLSSPLDSKYLNLSRFDLSVKYGATEGNFIRTFKDCYLMGEEETLSAAAGVGNDISSSAQPILEVYPFICKTIETIPLNT